MFDVISAGHLCVDISPKIPARSGNIENILIPGKLTNVNELVFATGGASANVGIALQKLGVGCAIVGKTGTDEIGDIITRLLEKQKISSQYIIRKAGEFSSYTIVVAPPGADRIFLHYTGANDTFTVADIDFNLLRQARLFHFGYPPIMKQFYVNDGDALVMLMKRAKETGITTSLDMSLPDPNSPSGAADWDKILSRVLPFVDIFVPSIEELMYMIDRKNYDRLKKLNQDILINLRSDYLSTLGDKVLGMGSKIAVIKCGTAGYYLRTAAHQKLLQLGRATPANLGEWGNKELFSLVYEVNNVLSSTGAGDCSIAGFLAAFLADYSPEWALNIACGTGAQSVTTYGATDGVVSLGEIVSNIRKGWKKSGNRPQSDDWAYHENHDLYSRG